MGQIHLRHDQNIAVIEIENPGRLNAFSRAMRGEIGRTLGKLDSDASTIAAVITGRGDAFCAGQDLNESVNWTEETPWVEEFDGFFRDLMRFKKPLVGAINGVAAGGGFQMALLCDARVGHPGVQMGQPEVKRGLASVTGTWLLQRSVGDMRARELALTGRLMDAEELKQIGILNHIVPAEQVLPAAFGICLQLAQSPADSYARTKTWLYESLSDEITAVLRDAARLHRQGFKSGVSQAGVTHFLRPNAKSA
ncbi:MAG: enoyl-CoA hydratase/isomerase family protein [Usitatibacter sp.]